MEILNITSFLGFAIRLALAIFLGFIVGFERQWTKHQAGILTNVIVCVGAYAYTAFSYIALGDNIDVTRIAAQVVSGVGFLGAGVIFVRNNLVSGLTTSAGMWATAGVGLAMGAGMYVVGICSAVMVVVIQFITHKISYFANVATNGYLRMTIDQQPGAVERMQNYLEGQRVEIAGVKINKNKKEEIKLEFDVVYPPGFKKGELIANLVEMDHVIAVSE